MEISSNKNRDGRESSREREKCIIQEKNREDGQTLGESRKRERKKMV
jgi:hypothetical protein